MSESSVDTSAIDWWYGVLAGKCQYKPDTYSGMLCQLDAYRSPGVQRIRLSEFIELLEGFARSSNEGGLSWSVAHSQLFDLDLDLGKAILGSRTLGTALHWLAQYYPLLQDSTSVQLKVEGDWATFSYRILDPSIWPRHEDVMFSLGICANLIKQVAPETWIHASMALEAEASALRQDQSCVVQADVLYGAPTNSLRFPAAILDQPLDIYPHLDGLVLRRLTQHLTQRQRSASYVSRCRDAIFDGMNRGKVGQEHVARQLGLSSRTLRRKLASENHSFQYLLDECRMQCAVLEFRKRDRQPLSELALKLGYSEHSTFSRAFHRWSGLAPVEYRRAVAAT